MVHESRVAPTARQQRAALQPRRSAVMRRLGKPRGPLFRWLNLGLRMYLAFVLSGCASSRPAPSTLEVRSMETRLYEVDGTELRRAVISVLQDLGYTVDTIDSEIGLITASRQATYESGEIIEERGEDDGLPMWAKVALVITGIFIILLIIGAFASDDDNDDDAYKDGRDSVAPHHHHAPVTFSESIDDGGPDVYQYRLTVNMQPGESEQVTRIRVSAQGAHYRGGKLQRAGPVHDPDFSSRFFAALEESVRLRSQGVSP